MGSHQREELGLIASGQPGKTKWEGWKASFHSSSLKAPLLSSTFSFKQFS